MAGTKVTLKLLIDQTRKKVLFAEAGNDFVDFLFNILTLPVGTVVGLLGSKEMAGCLGDLYQSIESLSSTYMHPNHSTKASVLKPRALISSAKAPPLLPDTAYSHQPGTNVAPPPPAPAPSPTTAGDEGGYVKGVVTYMVMDDLVVRPMSTITSITLLNQFHVKDLSSLQEKMVEIGLTEGMELLKASLKSKTVLTDVFFNKK